MSKSRLTVTATTPRRRRTASMPAASPAGSAISNTDDESSASDADDGPANGGHYQRMPADSGQASQMAVSRVKHDHLMSSLLLIIIRY